MTSECHWASHRCNIVPPTQILTVLCNLHFILLLIVPKVERAQRQIFWQHQGMNTSVCRAQRSSVLFNSSSPACHTAARHRGATHPHTVSLLAVCLSFYTSTGHIYSRVCVFVCVCVCVCVLQPRPLSRRLSSSSSSREVVRPNLQRGSTGRTAEMIQRQQPTAPLKTVRGDICVTWKQTNIATKSILTEREIKDTIRV